MIKKDKKYTKYKKSNRKDAACFFVLLLCTRQQKGTYLYIYFLKGLGTFELKRKDIQIKESLFRRKGPNILLPNNRVCDIVGEFSTKTNLTAFT